MNLDELIAICEAATPGPWTIHAYSSTGIIGGTGWCVATCGGHSDNTRDDLLAEQDANAKFAAAAREHFPACLRKLKRLRELHDKIYFCKVSPTDPMCIAIRASLTEAEHAELRQLLDLTGGEA